MFELNFRDERYLPFEGCGAISSWGLELPELKQFDYNTISDAVVHLKYTSQYDSSLKEMASDSVLEQLDAMQ
jgi:Tc toxin complex TcA C-terminal TcB-binding domain